MELENNLKKALNELDSRFDTIYTNLEKFLSKGVDESVQLCVASTKAIIAPVSVIVMCKVNHNFLALLMTLVFLFLSEY